MRTVPLYLVLASSVLTAGCRSARPRAVATPVATRVAPPVTPAHPTSVTALRYRMWVSSPGAAEYSRFSDGKWIEALWFPEWKLEANAEPKGDGAPRLNVFPSDYPHAGSKAGVVFVPTGKDARAHYDGATERVEVPWDLAQRIRSAAEHRARYEAEQARVGPELVSSGLLRKVPPGSTAP